LYYYFVQSKDYSFEKLTKQLKLDIYDSKIEFFKMLVPAGLFNLQNNLSFVALTYLDAATFQVLSQFKLLTTAIMSVLMLDNVRLSKMKWFSLLILIIGVSLIQVYMHKN
jgi:UDP-sugar transporter A1/2/3